MSASLVHLAELEDISTHERSTTDPATSEDEARRFAKDAISQKPSLRLIRIYQASVAIPGEGTFHADPYVVGPSGRYDTDILVWSERQAELLRRRAAGKPVNDADIDWPNIAEEIEDVGRSELRSCRSLLRQALRHMLKAEAWPLSRDAPTWRADAIDFRSQAKDAFTESMRQKIDVAALYADALKALPEKIDDQPPLPIQTEVPTLDELLSED